MSDKHRKARLKYLIDKDFGKSQRAFAGHCGRGKARISQMAGEKEPFGEGAAKRLATDAGLPPEWFNNDWPTPNEAEKLGVKIEDGYPLTWFATSEEQPRPGSAWPFKTFLPSQYYALDAEFRQKIEDELLGRITRMELERAGKPKVA